MENQYKVIIIGSGPAGLTAGIYCARANLKPLIIAGESFGGQLMLTTIVENYPGFASGVMGPILMNEMLEQAKKFGSNLIFKSATKVDFSVKPYKVFIGEEIYTAECVIIATGAKPKWLNLSNEKLLVGHGLSTCATCDAAFYKNKTVMVVGGGDTAMEDSTFLTKFAEKVYIVHRRNEFRASKVMQDKVKSNPKIEIIWESEIVEYLYKGEVKNDINNTELIGAKVKKANGNIVEYKVDGIFLAIGHEPMTSIFDSIEKDEHGYIKPVDNKVKTKLDGVFVCGDAEDHVYRQAIVAAGSGCMAAIEAEKYLTTMN